MVLKRDSLGRKIPKFDRSAAAKKAQQTNKKKYGADFHSLNGAIGGHSSKRGYFGTLSDAGKTDELKAISKKGVETQKAKRTKIKSKSK